MLKERSRATQPLNDRLDLFLVSSDIQRLHPVDPGYLAYVKVFGIEFPGFERGSGGYKRDIDWQRSGPGEICENTVGIPKYDLCPERRSGRERRAPLVTDVGGGNQIFVPLAKLESPR